MFDIESKNQDEVTIATKKVTIKIDVRASRINAGLEVGEIAGPGEFEIGDASIRGIVTKGERTIYDVEIGGVHVGVVGDVEDGLDDLGVSDVLCTSSVRAVREIGPKMIVSMGNVDRMVAELKLSARTDKKFKVKNLESLPTNPEIVVLN